MPYNVGKSFTYRRINLTLNSFRKLKAIIYLNF